MSMLLKSIKLLVIASVAGWLLNGSAAPGAAGQDLPEGPGAEITRNRCTVCHEADVIRGQRLSLQGWTREVEKMIRWGATVPDGEKETLVKYLAANFPVSRAAGSNSGGTDIERGKSVFDARCTVCHDADMTAQQRLTRQAWTREVEKMIRWGATVPDEEKPALIDYLSASFGLRPLKK